MVRRYPVAEVYVSNYCNFACDYCISGSTNRHIPVDESGYARVFRDLRYNDRGLVDYSRIRKYGLCTKGGVGDISNYGIIKQDGTIDRGGDFVLYNDFLDYDKLIGFIRSRLSGWVIQMGGGEPLFNPKCTELISRICETNRVILLTNLSLIRKNIELLDISNDRLFFRIGFHPEQYPISQYLNNMDVIRNSGKSYVVNFVYHPRYAANAMGRAYVDILRDHGFNYEVTRFHGTWNGVEYPLVDKFYGEGELVSEYELSGSRYSVSDVSKIMNGEMLSIYPDGNIYQCSKRHTCIGNIYTGRLDRSVSSDLRSCFGDGRSCQSIASQDNVIDRWLSGGELHLP